MNEPMRLRGLSLCLLGHGIAVVIAVLLVNAACTTGSGSVGEQWSRDYVTTHGRAYEAAAEALGDIDFYLESEEPDRGRIRARSSARRSGPQTTLMVDIRERGDRIRVDVMAQSPDLEEGRVPAQVSVIIRDFFHRLDARLEGRAD